MARIEQYQPEVQAAGPVGAVSPNLSEVDAVGNAVQRLGGTIEGAGEIVQRHQAQQEATAAYASFAKKRADTYGQVNDAIQDGSLDDEKGQQIMQGLQDYADSQSSNYGTAIGKNYFDRQSARLQSSLQQKISAGIAHVKGQETVQALDDATGDDKTAIMQDPDQFESILEGAKDNLDQQVQTGALPALHAAKAKAQIASEYAFTAIRSLTNMSPDVAKASLDSGYFTRHLDNSEMNEAYRIVEQGKRASDAQAKLNEKQQSDQDAIEQENAKDSYLKQIYSPGGLDLTKVLNNNHLNSSDKENLISVANRASEREQKIDPRQEVNLLKNIYSADNAQGHIGSVDQLLKMNLPGPLMLKGMDLLAKTPDAKEINVQRKLMLDQAEQTLGKTTPLIQGMPAVKDPYGPYKISQFHDAMMTAEQEAVKAGKPQSSIYNPADPNYIGKQLGKYQSPDAKVREALGLAKVQGGLGIPQEPPAVIHTAPGVPISAPSPTKTQAKVRQPGESPADFLKRVNGG